jgi:hypothetical protein
MAEQGDRREIRPERDSASPPQIAFMKRVEPLFLVPFFAVASSSFLSTESLDVGEDDVKTPGGSARLVRSATLSNDNLFLEDRATEGHVFDPSQFERLYLIGKGDVGRVYLCRTKASGKLCAMKVLDQVCLPCVLPNVYRICSFRPT